MATVTSYSGQFSRVQIRDRSLIMGRWVGLQNGRSGEASEVLPLCKRGGGQTCFSHTGVGHKKFLGSFKKGA